MQEQLQWPVIPVTIRGAYELFPLKWFFNQCGKVSNTRSSQSIFMTDNCLKTASAYFPFISFCFTVKDKVNTCTHKAHFHREKTKFVVAGLSKK